MSENHVVHSAPAASILARPKMTPPELAKLWRVAPKKVLAWISSGELPAVNVATDPNGERPRYLIDAADIAAFERSRAAIEPKPAPQKRRTKKPTNVTTYF